jgi:DNA-binding NtrC family response regulator
MEDVPMLVEYFVKRYAEKARKQISKIDKLPSSDVGQVS